MLRNVADEMRHWHYDIMTTDARRVPITMSRYMSIRRYVFKIESHPPHAAMSRFDVMTTTSPPPRSHVDVARYVQFQSARVQERLMLDACQR